MPKQTKPREVRIARMKLMGWMGKRRIRSGKSMQIIAKAIPRSPMGMREAETRFSA